MSRMFSLTLMVLRFLQNRSLPSTHTAYQVAEPFGLLPRTRLDPLAQSTVLGGEWLWLDGLNVDGLPVIEDHECECDEGGNVDGLPVIEDHECECDEGGNVDGLPVTESHECECADGGNVDGLPSMSFQS